MPNESGDVIWTARGLHHHTEVVSGPSRAARPSTARQYIAVDALLSGAAIAAGADEVRGVKEQVRLGALFACDIQPNSLSEDVLRAAIYAIGGD